MTSGRAVTRSDRKIGTNRRSVWLRGEFLAGAAAVICYLNVLPNEFCDDGVVIVAQNPKVNEPGQWSAGWTTDYWSDAEAGTPNRDLLYRPITLSSYRLIRTLAGIRPFAHHVVNILLHALISAMVVRLCRHAGGSPLAAMVAGLVFAVLPVHTAVLNNVVGRADLLATAGVLVTLLCHRRLLVISTLRDRLKWMFPAAIAAFVAMGSKENGIAVVALVPLWDALWHSQRPSHVAARAPRWVSIATPLRLAYLVIPTAAYLALRFVALGGHLHQHPALTKTVNLLVDAPMWQHALGVLQLWGMYWQKTVWPSVLCVDYTINSVRLATGPLNFEVLLGVLVAAGLAVIAIVSWRRGARGVAFAVAAVVIAYAPTANALVLIQVFFAERVWYFPSVWVAILAGMAAARFATRPVWYVVTALILCGMTARCWIRSGEWRHNGTLYAAAYRDHPDATGARYRLGHWLASHRDKEADIQRGIALLRGAIEIDLGFTNAQRALGRAYLKIGDDDAALRHLQIADMQTPGHPPTVKLLRLASERVSARDAPELARLREAAQTAPNDVEAELALVRKLRELGQLDEALGRLHDREARFHSSALWQNEFAWTLVYLDRRDPAIERYRKCLELDPHDAQRLVELSMLLLERRQGDDLNEAQRLADRAEKLAPGAPFVLICRAELLALRGDLDRAVALYREAIRTMPDDNERRRTLENRARALGGN
ncbi:MAG: hypothetical protein IIB60_05375 [Planctomycetes bacterium]|nr:hypothetical protein [Planctomycetota bacterium]